MWQSVYLGGVSLDAQREPQNLGNKTDISIQLWFGVEVTCHVQNWISQQEYWHVSVTVVWQHRPRGHQETSPHPRPPPRMNKSKYGMNFSSAYFFWTPLFIFLTQIKFTASTWWLWFMDAWSQAANVYVYSGRQHVNVKWIFTFFTLDKHAELICLTC